MSATVTGFGSPLLGTMHHRLGVISRALEIYAKSGLSGTRISDELLAFCKDHRARFRKWIKMMNQLKGQGR